jgi:hypothetical protein
MMGREVHTKFGRTLDDLTVGAFGACSNRLHDGIAEIAEAKLSTISCANNGTI